MDQRPGAIMLNNKGFLIVKADREQNIDRSCFATGLAKNVEYMSFDEAITIPTGTVLIFDVECYPNFFYIAFKSLENGKCLGFELSPDSTINIDQLLTILWRFCLVGFNSICYDIPIISLLIKGATNEELYKASSYIVTQGLKPFQFEKEYKLQIQKYNHIDLIEVAPLQGSLKLYAGRIHCKTMQDLPYAPEHHLTKEESEIVKPYCCNDLSNTELLFKELASEIKLRTEMSQKYGLELRSKSDPQIAEAVICNELKKFSGHYPSKSNVDINQPIKYNCPGFIKFKTTDLQKALSDINEAEFHLNSGGKLVWPKGLGEYVKTKTGWKWVLAVKVGKTTYKLGMGGIHSQEKGVAHVASNCEFLRDFDVTSYYPRAILNQALYPSNLGSAFLTIYDDIVESRIAAKKQRLVKVADSLKILINGSFGKFGSRFSRLFAPHLMLQVTITGQLSLMMLIEMLEGIGISVVSGNTDGIVCKYDKCRHEEVKGVIYNWEKITNFQIEETKYKATYSKDVNNYIAIKEDGGVKRKGCYRVSDLSKNPEHIICTEAAIEYLVNGTSVEKTINECDDITKFVSVRNVRGGGEKNGIYLGKVVRWYYGKAEYGHITYVKSGNKVPKTDGAKPLMDLPDSLPDDLDYGWYINTATDILYECGALKEPTTGFLFDFD